MAGQPYSFRVTVTDTGTAEVSELAPGTPPGVYQISGHDDVDAASGHTHTLSIVRHDAGGQVVLGASGYRGDGA